MKLMMKEEAANPPTLPLVELSSMDGWIAMVGGGLVFTSSVFVFVKATRSACV